jgi:hypothetical protein
VCVFNIEGTGRRRKRWKEKSRAAYLPTLELSNKHTLMKMKEKKKKKNEILDAYYKPRGPSIGGIRLAWMGRQLLNRQHIHSTPFGCFVSLSPPTHT